jgi:hypothetical protein
MVIKTEVRTKVVEDRAIGKPIKDIMTDYKISKASVHKILNERTAELNIGGAGVEIAKQADPANLDAVLDTFNLNTDTEVSPVKAKGKGKGKGKGKVPKAIQELVELPVEVKPESTWSNFLSKAPTVEDDKAQLIQKITLNVQYYGDTILKDLISDVGAFKASLIKKSPTELKNLLALFESTRNIESTSMYIRNTYFIGTKLLENFGGFAKMKLRGLTDRLRAEQDLEMIFKEIAIAHASKFSKVTSPEMKLLMVTLSTIVQVDMMNRIMGQQQPQPVKITQSDAPQSTTAQPTQQTQAPPQSEQSEQKDVEELLKKFSDI